MCNNARRISCGRDGDLVVKCEEGKELAYPLITNEHDCESYVYRSHRVRIIPDAKIATFVGLINRLKECDRCSYQFHEYCDGLHRYPFELKNGTCEFFRDKKLICRFAVPHFQYGTTMQNNYCKLKPEKRDGDSNQGWKWCCPSANTPRAERLKCYQARKRSFFSRIKKGGA
jgi:hypothetical protein